MSATLTATVESLHITAAQKLLELLQTEKDPSLLARLIATALRFKLPRLPRTPGDTPPPPIPSRPSRNTNARDDHDDADDPLDLPPPLPYTDEQYTALVRQYGDTEAATMRTRRFAIIAQINRERAAANSG